MLCFVSFQARETSYQELARRVIEKAQFLLRVVPNRKTTTTATSNNNNNSPDIASSVLNFVLHPIPLETIKRQIVSRRSRAFARVLGLRSIQHILKSARYPSMKHEVLSFLGPSLRSGTALGSSSSSSSSTSGSSSTTGNSGTNSGNMGGNASTNANSSGWPNHYLDHLEVFYYLATNLI